MKFCYQCGKSTSGENPRYCQFCGCSYGIKLCPKSHENPRSALVCSQCGAKDLSDPGPKIPVSWQLLSILIRIGVGLLLFYITLKVLIDLLLNPAFQQLLFLVLIILCGLWWLFTKLPDGLQEVIRALWRRNHDE